MFHIDQKVRLINRSSTLPFRHSQKILSFLTCNNTRKKRPGLETAYDAFEVEADGSCTTYLFKVDLTDHLSVIIGVVPFNDGNHTTYRA